MPLDPNIAMGYRGIEVPNQLAQYGQVQQLQANQMKMQEARAANDERNALRQLNPANADYENQLFKVNPQLGIQYRKERSAAEASQAQAELHRSTSAVKKTELFRDLLSNVQTPQQAAQWVQAQYSDPVLGSVVKQVPIEQAISGIPTDPKGFADWKNQNALGMTDYVKRNTLTEADRQRIGLDRQRVGLEGDRVQLAKDEAKLKREGIDNITPKELQKREAALPAATASVKGFEAKSDNFIKDLEALRDHPGLESITGAVYGRTPSLTSEGRAAQALYDKVVAKGGFQALQDLRDASKTGGALGNVSNQEGKQLSASFAAIQRTQDAADVKAAINQAIGDIEGAKTRTREAYDSTYSYKRPAAAAGGGVDTSNPLLKP